MVQWLRLRASNAGGVGSIPGWGTKISHAAWPKIFIFLIKKNFFLTIKNKGRASLVAEWLRIHLPMHGTRVRALAREDPTCRGATKPVCHSS